jgi:hypothetical protein
MYIVVPANKKMIMATKNIIVGLSILNLSLSNKLTYSSSRMDLFKCLINYNEVQKQLLEKQL